MNVYFVLSEWLEHWSYTEPPDEGCICEIVRAKSRGQAKWLAWKADRKASHACFTADMQDMPLFAVRKIGQEDGEPMVLPYSTPWWAKVPDECQAPKRKRA